MSRIEESPQDLETCKFVRPSHSQAHHYDAVTLSGSATAILGDIHHYHMSQTQDSDSKTEYRKTILDQLAYPDMKSRLQTLNEPYPDTFKWILNLPSDDEENSDRSPFRRSASCWDSFTDWLKDSTTPYWISGKLGTGKSTLMKFILENLSGSYNGYGVISDTIVISHFFWEPGSRLQNTVLGCLRTLLWQLIQLQESMHDKTWTVSAANLGSTGRLRNDLIKTIHNFDKTVVVLLDGLDECRETEDILDLVEALAALTHVKLVLSSRPEEAYVLQFSDFAKLRLQDLNKRDIEHYVNKELLENPRVRRSRSWTADGAKKLADTVILSAEGVFLWARLVVKDLLRGWTNRDDLDRMKKRLQKLPQDIYKLYTELIRRDQEVVTEYAKEAATYYQLLEKSSNREISLAAFFFAVNGGVRARYLDMDSVFDSPLAELERDVDLETIITWINVRTAGLLEVKIDQDIFYCNNYNRPGPHGKFMHFQEHWVGFIHRSAYTYLADTSEGQEIAGKCPLTSDALMNVYFESQLVAHLIVPGTYNFRFNILDNLHKIFPLQATKGSSIREWCRLLQNTCDNLFSRGLIVASKDWMCSPCMEQSPLSFNQTIELGIQFSIQGSVEIAEIFLQDCYDCHEGDQSMADRTLCMILNHLFSRQEENVGNDSDISSSLGRLATHLKAPGFMKTTQSQEQVAFPILLAKIATNFDEAHQAVPLWDFLQANEMDDCPLLLPTSKTLIDSCLSDHFETENIQIVATLSIKTMKAWSQGHDLGSYSASGRALLFGHYDCDDDDDAPGHDRSRATTFRIIDRTDSDEVLECLRSIVMSETEENRRYGISENCYWQFLWGTCLEFKINREAILSSGLKPIIDRSIRCSSFVDCLRRLGKSEETIDYAVGQQVKIDVHCGPEFRGKHFFYELLGSDHQTPASWIQKYPQLTTILEWL